MHRRTQPWAADDYNRHFDFVADHGAEVVDLLDPRKGESILDLGFGTGKLTHEIARRGTGAVGVDNDINMIQAARRRYPEIPFEAADAEETLGERRFHAVFSNAALHWMTRSVKVVKHVARALNPRGRFVAEMGGAGNIATIASALEAVCRERGLAQADFGKAWYFPTPDEYRAILESQGFEGGALDHFDRPTPLRGGEHGLRDWVRMFVPGLAGSMDEAVMDAVFQAVEERTRERLHHDGAWPAGLQAAEVRSSAPAGVSVSELLEHSHVLDPRLQKRLAFSYVFPPSVEPLHVDLGVDHHFSHAKLPRPALQVCQHLPGQSLTAHRRVHRHVADPPLGRPDQAPTVRWLPLARPPAPPREGHARPARRPPDRAVRPAPRQTHGAAAPSPGPIHGWTRLLVLPSAWLLCVSAYGFEYPSARV